MHTHFSRILSFTVQKHLVEQQVTETEDKDDMSHVTTKALDFQK